MKETKEDLIGTFSDYVNRIVLKKQEIMLFDKPNINGVIYPKKLSKEIVDSFQDFPDNRVLGKFGIGIMEDPAKVAFDITNPIVEGNILLVDIRIFETETGKVLKTLLEEDKDAVMFRFSGQGKVDKDGFVSEYKIKCGNVIYKEGRHE